VRTSASTRRQALACCFRQRPVRLNGQWAAASSRWRRITLLGLAREDEPTLRCFRQFLPGAPAPQARRAVRRCVALGPCPGGNWPHQLGGPQPHRQRVTRERQRRFFSRSSSAATHRSISLADCAVGRLGSAFHLPRPPKIARQGPHDVDESSRAPAVVLSEALWT